ncbi:MAG: hypothetical protein ACYS6K_18365 [Planctomycetota bacterium]|jgi:hypothetical protein
MKKAITQTIIALIIVNLITAGFAIGQDVIQEENQENLDAQKREKEIALKEAEFAVQEAQKESEAVEEEAKVAAREATRQVQIARKLQEEAQKEAQKQMTETEKQMKAAILKQMDVEQKVNDLMVDIRVPDVAHNITLGHLPHFQHSGGGGVLVIPSAQMKVENLAAITEDLSIMSRLFDKKLYQVNEQTPGGRLLVNVNPYLGRGNRTTEAIYLEGYGALFLMKINMLLSAPPEAQKKEKSNEDTDPVWAQMRREMYEPEEVRRSRSDDRPEEKYSALVVGNLKATLIETLKHATNIQALKPEQLVILTVIGERHRPATVTRSYSYGRSSGTRSSYRRTVQTAPKVETSPLLPTVLTICAKKSDIDAFAKGEIDYDQFRQRTGIFTSYAKAGQQNFPSVNRHQLAHEEHQAAHEEHSAF